MSKIIDMESKVRNELAKINITELKEKSILASYLHDRIVPIINEVVMSASNCKTFEDAYKKVIDNLRAVHEKIAAEKRDADQLLLTSVGREQALTAVMKDLSELADAERDKVKAHRVEEIAKKIQSGSFDPDVPRKPGERPETIKNIRAAKQTLFGASKKAETE